MTEQKSTTEPGGPKSHMRKVTIFQNKATSTVLVIGQYP